jgi:hypothetical protein
MQKFVLCQKMFDFGMQKFVFCQKMFDFEASKFVLCQKYHTELQNGEKTITHF